MKQWPKSNSLLMKRQQCTAENPYTEERDASAPESGWTHEGAEFIRSNADDTIDYYRCRDCGLRWRQEVAQ